jgi:DNA end-binding protein Ku
MARALWKGMLSFGLVNIPVELHTAVRDSRPSFRLLRAKDRSRIQFQRVAERDGDVVKWDDIVKGYEYEKGRFIVLTPEDLAAAAAKKDRTIQIVDFVESQDIDDRYFEKPYYLVPGPGAAKAYALFREAMRRAGRTGIAKFVFHDTEHLAAIETIGEAIVLTTLRFREEVVDPKEYDFPPARGYSDQDLKLAARLIDEFTGKWDPDQYTDEYRQHIMQIVKARRKHQEPHIRVAEEKHSAQVVDLMERLRQSLGTTTGKAKRTSARSAKGESRRKAGAQGRRKSVA